jgi:hypothetical protein
VSMSESAGFIDRDYVYKTSGETSHFWLYCVHVN